MVRASRNHPPLAELVEVANETVRRRNTVSAEANLFQGANPPGDGGPRGATAGTQPQTEADEAYQPKNSVVHPQTRAGVAFFTQQREAAGCEFRELPDAVTPLYTTCSSCRLQRSFRRFADFSAKWITSGLPTTRKLSRRPGREASLVAAESLAWCRIICVQYPWIGRGDASSAPPLGCSSEIEGLLWDCKMTRKSTWGRKIPTLKTLVRPIEHVAKYHNKAFSASSDCGGQ